MTCRPTSRWVTALAALALASLITACGPPEPATGLWRGEIDQYGDLIPFNFEVVRSGGPPAVYYINGTERLPVEQVRFGADGRIELNFPSYGSGLTARLDDAGGMGGEVFLRRRDQVHRLPFRAVHGRSWRFFPEPAAAFADVAGRWEVQIVAPALNLTEQGLALFEQQGPYVSGTVQTPTGDYRFLHGEVRDRELYLSAFDGNGTQLWRASLQDDGTLAGSFDSVTYRKATWIARRNAAFRLADPTSLTWLRPGHERVQFTFPDLDGRPVSLADPRFRNKVVVIVIAGSWCPTCHDEAEVMVPLYAASRDRGLEIVYLMFEYSDNFADVADQVRAFRDRFGITQTMLFAGSSDRLTRGEALPMLNDILAFPTTIILDRSGQVRKIHTSFPGPATGQAHEDYKREMTEFLELLLSEAA
jgi:peroxiredoxin